jgi:hypothetical protein
MVPQDVPLKYQCDYDQLRAETIMQNMEVMHTLGLPTTTPKQVFISFFEGGGSFFLSSLKHNCVFF